MLITDELASMRQYFNTGITRSYAFRREQLKKLKQSINDHEQALFNALLADLKKSPEESWVTENGMVMSEINTALRDLRNWMRPEYVPTTFVNFPSRSFIVREPLGVVIIIGPWNYPFQLLINPLVGAIAAGNCVVLKPSEYAPATAGVMRQIIEAVFPKEYILYVEGDGATLLPGMMEQFRFDHVFFTGSSVVGKKIYQMAAAQLAPVTLELGGKSPCVVDSDADIKVAARRIAVAKFSNSGQMCVAPDYVLVHESKKDQLLAALCDTIPKFFGEAPENSYNYGKIINQKQFDRITRYLKSGKLICGGKSDRETLYIEPAILVDVLPDDPVMNDEIFGPVLPVLTFSNDEEARAIISRHQDPLAFYIFTSNAKKETYWIESVPAGGVCINNTSWHLTNHYLPFGGRGASGSGQYHGRYSFETFSHRKAVMKTPTWFDPDIKYPPFKGRLNLFKWIVR
jgi:aldehyde dehydrogenase (NAD+)